jgi:hypothetical protein
MFIRQIHLKINHMIFFTFHSDMKPCDTKRQVTTQKKKNEPKKNVIERHD